MFFFAFFGIQDKDKYMGTYNNIECPSCGRFTACEIHKLYTYFHIFLIPVFKWNIRYVVKFPCCGYFEMDPILGKEFEKNPGTQIKKEALRRVETYYGLKYCSNCKTGVHSEFSFCPYCGGKL
ncbi:MAG TPA: zinc ribbon domain-containing protein [Clostridiales bacterium]|nr:zinc ribbon domain-containing protein [Clostridiales bacterium]